MIDTDEKLAVLLPWLRRAAWIALDTEADSLHAYPEKLCLMQVSIEGEDRLLDPLARMNLASLFEALAGHELIMHGADYDLRLLRKHGGFVPSAIFDTMLAARLLGQREFGLVNLVAKHLGTKLEKGPQKANWARRPLTPRMEAYARHDTHFLKPLADILAAELRSRGRLAWHQQACARLIAESSVPRPVDPDEVWRVKGSHQLSSPALSVVRQLWHWREREAISSNRPPFFILPPASMVKLGELAAAGRDIEPHLPRYLTPRRCKGVLHAIEVGLADKHPPGPLRRKGRRLSEAEKHRLHALEEKRNRRALELGLDPTLIASRATLVAVSDGDGAIEQELLPWQRELLS